MFITLKKHFISFDLDKARNREKDNFPYHLNKTLDYLKGFKEIKIRIIKVMKLGMKSQKFYFYIFLTKDLFVPLN